MVAQLENNGIGGQHHMIDVKARHTWNADDEDVLLVSLKELVATGWKSDNGFHAGYIYKLEEMMMIRFPRTDIQANPHIMSNSPAGRRTTARSCIFRVVAASTSTCTTISWSTARRNSGSTFAMCRNRSPKIDSNPKELFRISKYQFMLSCSYELKCGT